MNISCHSAMGWNSSFAMHFLSALRDNPTITIGHDVSARIRKRVMHDERQSPEYERIPSVGDDGGDFVFVRRRSLEP